MDLLEVDWSPTGVGEVRVGLLGVDWSPTTVGEGGFAMSRYVTYWSG